MADEVGLGTLTLSALAERLGVMHPSLYKHLEGGDNIDAIRAFRSLLYGFVSLETTGGFAHKTDDQSVNSVRG